VKPPILNATPKGANAGKDWKWQLKQAAPVWRANAGIASDVVGAIEAAETATTTKAAAERRKEGRKEGSSSCVKPRCKFI